MKHSFSIYLVICCLLTATLPDILFAGTGSCPLNGGDPLPVKNLTFTSVAFDAALIGYPEFTNVSTPPKRYRRKTIKGDQTYHIFVEETCDVLWGDYKSVYDLTCQWDRTTGAFSSTNNSYLDYFLSDGPQPMGVSCDYQVNGTKTATTDVSVFGDGTCGPYGWVTGYEDYHAVSATGTVTAQLEDQDTASDAEQRATKNYGNSNTAFRTNRSGLTFSACKVNFEGTVDVGCSGDYDIYLTYSIKPHGATGPVTTKVVIVQLPVESGPRTLQGEIEVEKDDTDYTLLGAELRAPCSKQPPSHPEISIGSIKVALSLGRGTAGVTGGELRLDAEAITAATYTPAGLTVATMSGGGVEVVSDAGGALRQVKAPETFADIVTLSPSSYEVRFYGMSDLGVQDTTTKIYTLTGTPYAVFKFENPDAAEGLDSRLRITETRGSVVRVSEYSYDTGTNTWSLSTGNSLRQESTVVIVAGSDTTKTSTVRDGNNVVVSKTSKTYRAYPWGSEVIRQVLDPDGAALTTATDFYSDVANDGGAYSRLKQVVNSDSSWVRYTYDSSSRPLKVIRPYLDAVLTATDNLCRVTENSYSALPDADGDGTVEQLTTTVETTLGQETSRSYRIDWSATVALGTDVYTRRSDIRCSASGAAWNDSTNLVTETLSYTTGPFMGRARRVLNPDGTASLTSYDIDGGGQTTTTVKSGAVNATFDDIIAGTITITNTSAMGQVTGETVTDITSGLTLSAWTATATDNLGRPTRLDYADGTYETRDYACCGLSSSRDRTGVTTTYVYDDLGRQTDSVRNGITMRNGYDADSRTTSVTRIGTDNSAMVQETDHYDLAGRLTQRLDALNRITGYAEVFDGTSGEMTRTTANPDLGTRIELRARDGSLLNVSGTATAPLSYDYGIDATGVFTKETKIGAQNATTEWTKSYTDFAGRSFKTVYADNATTQSYFNSIGQLIRQVDPDGVTTLFAYNNRGEQEVSAVDLNGNNTIDYDGTDRITKSVNTIAAKTDLTGSYTVRRTTVEVWEADAADTPVKVSISEQSTDGLHSWQTSRGLVSSSVTVLDGNGGRTTTSSGPDAVKTIQVYANGNLISTTAKTAADDQLAATTNGYDAQGRLQTSTDARNGVTTYTYYADDQIHTVLTPDPDPARSGPGYDPQTTTYTYNAAGRVDTVTQPDGGVVNTSYYLSGAMKRTWGSRTYPTEYFYDPQGRVKTLTTWQDFSGDAGKAVTTWSYNPARGWLDTKRYNDNTGPAYTYWPSGRLHTRTWARTPVVTTTYSYTPAGDVSGVAYSDATPAVTMTYDRAGRLKTRTDAAGLCTWGFDPTSGQLKDEDYTAGLLNTLGVHRTYDAQFRLNSVSALSATSAFNQVAYGYDAASRFQTVTSGTNTATYTYTPNSPLIGSITFAQSGTTRLVTTKTYDNLNRLSSISSQPSALGAQLSAAVYTYNDANQRTKATREDSAYWNYSYDTLGQVTAGKKYSSTDALLPGYDYAWSYDDIGNRKTATTNSQISKFTADLLNQYSSRTVPGVVDVSGAAAVDATVTVSLNNTVPQATTRTGELFYKQLAVSSSDSAQNPSIKITGVKNGAGANGGDALTTITKNSFLPQTPETFSYDADGNLTDDARWHYTWDAENRLIAMESQAAAVSAGVSKQRLDFAYDGQGRRVQKKVSNWNGAVYVIASSTLFLYDGWNLIAEMDALNSNAVVCTYVWGLDLSGSAQGAGGVSGLLAVTNSSATYATAFDGNGNVIGLVDMATGIKSATYDYNAFGETIQSDGVASVANHFRFSTKYTDDETGLLYYGFRYYSSSVGRWLSKDPIEEQGGANLYGFIDNDGIDDADSFGLRAVPGSGRPFGQTHRNDPGARGISLSLDAAWDTIISHLPKHPVVGFSVAASTPIGTIGAVTVNLGFEITGDVQQCSCSANGSKYKFSGTISGTVYAYTGAKIKIPKVGVPSGDRSVDVGIGSLEPCGESDLEDLAIDISGKLGLGVASVSLPLINWTAKLGWKGELSWPKGSLGLEGDVSLGVQGAGSKSGHLIYQ